MYSPKIEEKLIPVLYRLARSRGKPMTQVVSYLIRKGLKNEALPGDIREALVKDAGNVPQ